jgi:DNA-binding NtrC family response regulator
MLGHADEIRSWGSYTKVPLTPGEEPTALPDPVVPTAVFPKTDASALRRVLRRARDGVALNVDEAEAKLIERALEKSNGNRTRAADLLGISVRTLRNKLNRPKLETS